MEEEWRAIPGWEGFYDASSLGQIKSLRSGKLLKQTIDSDTGYPGVVLSRPGCRRTYAVHQLVALAFIGELPEGMYVCHNDRVKTHNWIGNLRHDTPEGNAADEKAAGAHWNTQKDSCSTCGGPLTTRKSGKRFCQPCAAKATKAWKEAHPESVRAHGRKASKAYRERQR